jgi:methyl-accepting chemotaxis protein
MKIRGRLTTLSLLFGILPLAVAAVAAYLSASDGLEQGADDRLAAIRDAKRQQIELYFNQIRDQVVTLSASTMIQDAMADFRGAFSSYADDVAGDGGLHDSRRTQLERYYREDFGGKYSTDAGADAPIERIFPGDATALALQSAYIGANPHPLGQKENLDAAADGTAYSALHARYHPVVRDYLRRFGYYDIFLVDIDSGRIVYSVFKELDYATSLTTGPYASTNFAEAFRRAAAADNPDSAVLVDFARYTPSYEAPASFIASPVFKDGEKIGVLIFQMPIDRITEVLSQRTGMGETGEVYLVGADGLMRSNSRFEEGTTILSKRIETLGVQRALAGETGSASFADYRGVPVLSAYSPVEIDGVEWAILAEIDAAEAFAAVSRLGWFMLALTLLTAVLVSIAAAWNARRLAAPIVQASGVAANITRGSLDNRIEATGNDESAELLRALDAMQQDLKRRIQSEEQAAQNERIKAALDAVGTPVVATGTDRRVIYSNAAASALFEQLGSGGGELVGSDLGDLVEGLGQGLGGSDHAAFEHRWVHGDFTVDCAVGPVRDGSGTFRGWVAQMYDRTEALAAQAAERTRIEQERREAAANTRIKVALDNVSSPVLVADTERRVIYANRAAEAVFRDTAGGLRSALPDLKPDRLVGTALTSLIPRAQDQQALLDEAGGSRQAELQLGERAVRVVTNVVVDPEGQRLGTAVEWADRTAEVAVEREIDDLVEAAGRGDLGRRIALEGKEGFFLRLGSGFNSLLDQLSGVFGEIARVMGRMADGDLRDSIESSYSGTFDAVKRDVNRTLENLRDIVGQLTSVADQVGSAVDEIASGNTNLSNRTEQQASSLEQTAAAIEELTVTVRNNVDSARQADQLAAGARTTAQRGGEVVEQAVGAMAQISASSKKIGEIIGVIDEIAFQTNLLALNASVEAARAGEQGRGFAVVATEVRNLASRSAEAAREIRELIRSSAREVEGGSELVNESGKALTGIVESVKKVGDIVAEIAAASVEQSAGIDQVNNSVSAIDGMTQQNAALAEQTSSASINVRENAGRLRELVAFFRT